MKVLEIRGSSGNSKIFVGGKISHAAGHIHGLRVFIITDQTVKDLYQDDFPKGDVITIGRGEKNKTLKTVEFIHGELIRLGADRSSFILGIGGGIVCDITGFVASTFMRGVRFGFVSSTLLSQVDASVGGKNGVNFGGYKNMIGVFSQPEFVVCDIEMLNTLPPEEIRCGFGEIIKHALIEDEPMIEYLEENCQKAKALDPEVIGKLVYDSVVIKSNVVNRDEKEGGERKKLNFGHTVGHAVEKLTGKPHGEAVGLGMVAAAEFSCKKGYITRTEVERIKKLIESYDLPVTVDLEKKDLIEAMKKDKKKERDMIYFIFLQRPGQSVVEKISMEDMAGLFH